MKRDMSKEFKVLRTFRAPYTIFGKFGEKLRILFFEFTFRNIY